MDPETNPNPNPFFVYSTLLEGSHKDFALFMAACNRKDIAIDIAETLTKTHTARRFYIYHAEQDCIVWDSQTQQQEDK